MARAIWNGSLSFGLVNVPIELYSATEDKTIHFNQFEAGTSDRVRNRRVNERTGEEVDFGDVVKGYDVGGGEYVIVSSEELESAEPGRTRNVEITDFVDLDAIDPVYYQKTYYLAPKGEQAERAYGLLRKAMEDSNKVAIATLVMRGKQYLVAVRPERRVLVLETMFFADEVRDPAEEIPGIPLQAKFTGREVDTAKMLIDSMTGEWKPGQYHDTYRQRVLELIERKRTGEEIVVGRKEADPAPVIDLVAALEASVEAVRTMPKSNKKAASKGAAPAGRNGKSSAKDLSALSKAELYDRATELDLPGRSRMSRDELLDALAAQAGGRRGRKAS